MALDERPVPLYSAENQPIPPSYSTPQSLAPAEVLELALEDLALQEHVAESQFYIPQDQRQNPQADILHQSLVDTWQSLPNYDTSNTVSVDTNWPGRVIEAFFTAIAQRSTVLVEQFLDKDLLDANTPRQGSEHGLTPLLCAIQYGHSEMVNLLIGRGARVNDFGICRPTDLENARMREPEQSKSWTSEAAVRTPIQLAAQLGNLELVTLLLQKYSADDSLLAPDGQLALRLASRNGHKDVVKHLPVRRGGGYRRWKSKHHKIMKKVKDSVHILRTVVVFTCYTAPKWCVKMTCNCVGEVSVYCWKNKHKLPRWCWKELKRTGNLIVRLVVNAPQNAQKFVKNIGKLLVRCWEYAVILVTKKIPKIAALVWKFAIKTAKDIGNTLLWILNRTASLLHTMFSAILNALKSLTWSNIRDGFVDLLRAIFISFPQALWRGFIESLRTTGKILVVLFGGLAYLIWGVIQLTWFVIKFLTLHALKVMGAVGRTTVEAGKEVYIWVNPKA